MPHIPLDSGELFYEVNGKGVPLVLCRGLGRSSQYWLDFEKHFSEDFKIITFDHRGLGRSTAELSWTDSMATLARDLVDLLDYIDVESAHIFGLSLGGMLAMEFAASFPERCKSLIIANSSSGDHAGFRINPKIFLPLGFGLLNGTFQDNLRCLVTSGIIEKRLGHHIKSYWHRIGEVEDFPWYTIAKQLLIAAQFKINYRIDGRRVPTLILYGNQDRFVPKENSFRIHKSIPHSRILALRGVGHEISLGRSHELIRIIDRHVTESESGNIKQKSN